jgi:glutamyl-tRNA(Gln) amidotransferase subunit E
MAMPDGTTRYMRPRPGAARLYPETDIPSMPVTPERLEELKRSLPLMPEQVITSLIEAYKVNRKLAEQLADSDYLPLFKEAVKAGVSASFAAAALTEIMKGLERRGIPVERLEDSQILEIFQLIGSGKTAKENFALLVEEAAKTGEPAQRLVEKLGLKMMSTEEVEALIEKHISAQREQLKDLGGRAFSQLMKLVMAEARGKADPALVSAIAKRKLQSLGI